MDEVLCDSDRTHSFKSHEMGLVGVWIGGEGDCDQDGLRVDVQRVGGRGLLVGQNELRWLGRPRLEGARR